MDATHEHSVNGQQRPVFDPAGLPEHIAAKISIRSDGCWEWTAFVNKDGYGAVTISRRTRKAHRVVYELLAGPIPDGLSLDHLCHTQESACSGDTCPHRRCVNPAHLEPVTQRENVLRGKNAQAVRPYCGKGHPFDEENTYRPPSDPSRRLCKACRCRAVNREYKRAWEASRKSAKKSEVD